MTTTTTFALREATAADAAAIAELAERSPDGGAVSFRVRNHVDAESAYAADPRTSVGVVAEVPGIAGVAGSARMFVGRCRYEGTERPYALLGSLMVDPAARRRGIGAALARWRIEKAVELAGDDVVVVANIQRGNEGSLANARRWATSFTEPHVSVPLPMRGRAPRLPAGLVVRDAVAADHAAIVAGVGAYAGERNLSRVWTEESLGAWLAASPLNDPVDHYRVAVDAHGDVVAGLALREEGRMRSLELVRVPAAIRAANLLLRVLPPDGVMRNLTVEHLWCAPGRLDAAAALWEETRWSWRERGSNLLITIDGRDPVRGVLGLRPWTPATSFVTAVRAEPALDPARLVEPLL